MRAMNRLLLVFMITLTPAVASAQAETDTNLFWDVTKAVIFDPTTYAPATITYTAQRLDWKSSQVFFEHGWLEQTPCLRSAAG